MCEICLKFTIITPERQWRHSGVFNINFEQISRGIIWLIFPIRFSFFFSKICSTWFSHMIQKFFLRKVKSHCLAWHNIKSVSFAQSLSLLLWLTFLIKNHIRNQSFNTNAIFAEKLIFLHPDTHKWVKNVSFSEMFAYVLNEWSLNGLIKTWTVYSSLPHQEGQVWLAYLLQIGKRKLQTTMKNSTKRY